MLQTEIVCYDMNGPERTLVQHAANGSSEPKLPNFCNAANGHFFMQNKTGYHCFLLKDRCS